MFKVSGEKLNLSSGMASATSTICFSTALMSRSTTEANVGADCCACTPVAAAVSVTWRKPTLGPMSTAKRVPVITAVMNSTSRILFISVLLSTRRHPLRGLRPRPRLTAWKIVPDDFAAFHHQANALEFGDAGEGMARDRDQVGKFAGLNRSNMVLPAQHFCWWRPREGFRAAAFRRRATPIQPACSCLLQSEGRQVRGHFRYTD